VRRSVRWMMTMVLGLLALASPPELLAGKKTPEERRAKKELRGIPKQFRRDAKLVSADALAKMKAAVVGVKKGTLDPGDAVREVSDAATQASRELGGARSEARSRARQILLGLLDLQQGRVNPFAQPGACGTFDHALEKLEIRMDKIERRVQKGVKKAGRKLSRRGIRFNGIHEPLDWREDGSTLYQRGERLSEVLATSNGDVLVRFGFDATERVEDLSDPLFGLPDPDVPLHEVFCAVLWDSEGNYHFRTVTASQVLPGLGSETSVRFSGISPGRVFVWLFKCGRGVEGEAAERFRERFLEDPDLLTRNAHDREFLYVPEPERDEPGPGPVACDPGGTATFGGGTTRKYPIVETAEFVVDDANHVLDGYILCKASDDPGAGLFQVLVTPESGLALDEKFTLVLDDLVAAGVDVKEDPNAGDSIDANFLIDGTVTITFPGDPSSLGSGDHAGCVRVHVDGTTRNEAADREESMIGEFGTGDYRLVIP